MLGSNRKSISGVVKSIVDSNTAVIVVQQNKKHALYNKILKTRKKYSVDSNGLTLKIGQQVKAYECKPISKTKKWKLDIQN